MEDTMPRRKIIFIIAAAAVCCAMAAAGFFTARAVYKPEVRTYTQGKIRIEVVDGFTDTPVCGADVVIPEINQSFTTDENGLTPLISVPIKTDSRFNDMLPQDWGGISVLVYCDGYTDYALFYTHVRESEERDAVRIYLFEEGSTGSSQPFSIIEGPERQWVQKMLDKYRP